MNEEKVRALIHAFHEIPSCHVCPFHKDCTKYLMSSTSNGIYMGCEEFIYRELTNGPLDS